jgi:hypothetical protein
VNLCVSSTEWIVGVCICVYVFERVDGGDNGVG